MRQSPACWRSRGSLYSRCHAAAGPGQGIAGPDLLSDLTAEEQAHVDDVFPGTMSCPCSPPRSWDSRHPLPHSGQQGAVYRAPCCASKSGKAALGLRPRARASLPPYLPAAGQAAGGILRLETICMPLDADPVSTHTRWRSVCVICVTRNADLSFDDEKFEDNDGDFRQP